MYGDALKEFLVFPRALYLSQGLVQHFSFYCELIQTERLGMCSSDQLSVIAIFPGLLVCN